MKFKTYIESTEQHALQSLVDSLKTQYPGLSLYVTQNNYSIYIHEIKSAIKNQGIGTNVIKAIQNYAQSVNLPITLSPEPEPRMKAKLLNFYKRLGFYNNQGQRKDYRLGGFASGPTWVWRPSMKEWFLLESEQSVIMYHGTSMKSWADIKQNGLSPFPDARSWDEDPSAGWSTPSRVSYGGIYITNNISTATGSAWRTAKKNGSGQLLLAMSVDPRTLIADEDSVTFHSMNVPIPSILTTEFSASELYISLKNNLHNKYVNDARDLYVSRTLMGLSSKIKPNEALEKMLKKYLGEVGFEAALTRLVAHADSGSREYAMRNYKFQMVWPSKQEGEIMYKNFIDRLTYLMRKLANPQHNSSLMHSARSLKPIGFEGRNKIIYAAELIQVPYKTDSGHESNRTALKKIYGEAPPQLIQTWEEREGKWMEV